ncbi:TIGR02646 family protein [Chromobacterium subtsugae]|uniref:TIGR02646 family protein n=1 Tax=Chromobacterium subtsugae TaxID=251747 RepID=A0ABS7FGQ9_9NEIS|nr:MULTISPECIES: retron Ec78 anti-phage system effector HNH endonuclease PtuB [Chromobacterium]MBW7568010.1 TIGR02646 family protein [Chromobacterium subtsugae]MBW8289237.1 TIGR02646 family protein [Chromobacterium subtsugae]WSE92720.1 retron Ec78 anti-phage system effector HNH endonuclease PtuB [Chromobacterium subtsugae]WVH61098.1 retron Ec78 anti-phage system effector HNH endonuclease PtuB [Chromobacterium subtsugae]
MKKLVRPLAPVCLSKYKHGRDNWGSVSPQDKADIRQVLNVMQGDYCAYCESKVSSSKQQIEHFKDKKTYPKLTFDWSNLFGSCKENTRCGQYKDGPKSPKYNPEKLIKPDVDYFVDYVNIDEQGRIIPRSGIGLLDKERVDETLKAFNLNNDPGLLKDRFDSINALKEIYQYLVENCDDFSMIRSDMQDMIKSYPFQTLLSKYFEV